MKTRYILTLAITLIAAFACIKEESCPMKWVDLRYDVPQDSYLIDKDGAQTVSIRVKSTDPWTVFGMKGESWYTITPDSGDSGEIYTVTITCEPNTGLDDRRDTIVIKSDYWTGKEFLLTQKGTAYLEYETPQLMAMEGGEMQMSILSNQDWKAEVITGQDWLEIVSGASANGDEHMTLQADGNAGEQRSGEIALYDRNGIQMHTISVTQIGVILSPALPENGNFYVLYNESQQITIPVESNVKWTVAKKVPDEETWYEIDGGSQHEGNTDLVINVSEYAEGEGTAVREGTLVLSTVAAQEGGFTLVKTIRFKQASPDANRTQTNEGKVLDMDGLRSEDGIPAGRYTFYLSPFTVSDCIYLYFFWHRDGTSFAELRFWLNTGHQGNFKTEIGCMPYCNDVNKWKSYTIVPFDNTRQVKFAMDIKESAPDTEGNTWLYSEWWLGDKMIAKATSDGIVDADGKTDNWKTRFSDTVGTGYFRIWANKGSATLEKWEYTAPIVWGE